MIQGEKLQKMLARGGFGSRREIERMIEQGLVQLNGRTAKLGDRAVETDKIQVRGHSVKNTRLAQQPTEVLYYHKPDGLVCSRSDEQARDTIFSQLPPIRNGRWISIGRLDINTSGLLLVTNNGELANRLMHPSYELEREYAVRIFGEVTEEILTNLRQGVVLEDGEAKFNHVSRLPSDEDAQNQWYRVILKEGRYREVRRLWESQGVQVSRLMRVRYGDFSLPSNLRRGQTRAFDWKEVNRLLKSVDLPQENRPDQRQSAKPETSQTVKKPIRQSRSASTLQRRRR
jgi:23S rRNA pseudouridine2605 synthase